MRANSNQHGTAIIHLFIFAVLWLVATFAFFAFYGTQKILEQEVAQKRQLIRQSNTHQLEVEKRLRYLESLTGFYTEGSENRAYLKEARVDVLKLLDNINKLNSAKDEGKEPEKGTRHYYGLATLPSPGIQITKDNLTKIDYAINVENIVRSFMARIQHLQKEHAILNDALKMLRIDQEIKVREKEDVTRKLREILDGIEAKSRAIETKFNKQLEQIREQKNRAQEEKEKTVTRRNQLEKQVQSERIEAENDISKKKNEIRKLQAAKYGRTTYSEITKQREFDPSQEKEDGVVVLADPRANTIYVNVGEAQKLARGLKFDVYRRAEKGTRAFKGRIEIQKVMPKLSMASIIEMKNRLDPIVNGDFIVNPVFNEERPVYFAFAGKFKKVTQERAKKLIEQLGSKIETEVTAKTNFVIIGDDAKNHANYNSAVSFGIPLMTEETLLKYIGD